MSEEVKIKISQPMFEFREYLKDLKYDTECCKVCDTMSNKVLDILDKGE